jgi:ABC-type branched-subunit amino acid transport system substrate-binding protein/predicted negative regulator of RcsB-dependent stress response
LLVLLSGLWGAPLQAADPEVPPPTIPAILRQAQDHIQLQDPDGAILSLKQLLTTQVPRAFLDDIYLSLASAYLAKADYQSAISYLQQLLSQLPDSDLAPRAKLLLGQAHANSGNAEAAMPFLTESSTQTEDGSTKREALKFLGDLYVKQGIPLNALKVWLEESATTPGSQVDEPRARIRALLLESQDRKFLGRVQETYPATYPGDLALLRLIDIHENLGDDFLTEKHLRQFLLRFGTHESATTVQEKLQTLKSKLKTSQYVLGAVLPLSGRLGPFGIEALNGIRLALDQAKEREGSPSIALLVKDHETLGKSELSDLVNEYHPYALIGPLLSRNLANWAPLAEQTETVVVTPAAGAPDLRRLSSFFFSTATTPLQQVSRLADYAVNHLGYRKFGVLHPDTPYGHDLATHFTREIRQWGAEIIGVEAYKEKDTDLGPAIGRLKSSDLKRDGQIVKSKTNKGKTRLTYQPGFDALFLPSDGRQLALLTSQLVFYEMRVAFLGTNTWNSPELVRSERSLEGSVFVDGFFTESPDQGIRDFVRQYRQRFQTDPTFFASQAYEATTILVDAIRSGIGNGKTLREYLTKTPQLRTLNGPGAFGQTGTLNRKLYLIQITHGRFLQVNNDLTPGSTR